MPEDRESHKTTYEDLLMDSVYHMRIAKREGEEYIFDELIDEIEMLFGLVPEINRIYQPIKQELEKLAGQNIQKVKNEAATIDDNILKDIFSAQKTAIVKWEFRTDMLEAILTIMNDYQMLPYKNPYIGELGLGELEENTEDELSYEEVPNEIQSSQQPPLQIQPLPQNPEFPPLPSPENQEQTFPKRQFPKRQNTQNE